MTGRLGRQAAVVFCESKILFEEFEDTWDPSHQDFSYSLMVKPVKKRIRRCIVMTALIKTRNMVELVGVALGILHTLAQRDFTTKFHHVVWDQLGMSARHSPGG